jgi:hypothetical protein
MSDSIMSDSMKIALASSIACTAAWLGPRSATKEPLETAAFLLYFIWPGLSLVLAALTAFFAFREMRKLRRGGAVTALATQIAIQAFTWTHFYPFG